MFDFILSLIIMIAAGAMLTLMIRALPRVEDAGAPEKRSVFERWATSEFPERIDAAFHAFLVKFFRRLKIALLKVDNFLNEKIKKIPTEANGNGKTKIDFREITGEKSVAEEDKNSDN